VTEPLLPETTSDETDVGWGDDEPADEPDERDDDRLRDERPPHYDRG
jgi:hypothetical protein